MAFNNGRIANRGGSPDVSEPQRNDACYTWSAQQLARMNSNFCSRVTTAFRAGSESVKAATATYDLSAQRRSP